MITICDKYEFLRFLFAIVIKFLSFIVNFKVSSLVVSLQCMTLLVHFRQKILEKNFFHNDNFCLQCQTQTCYETARVA